MTAQAVRLTSVDIDNAFANAHFDIVFQPIVQLTDRSVLRREVFVRWDHPGLGALPPGAFIAFFEAQGRIGDLTRFVLHEALSAYASAGEAVNGGLSINLSAADLQDAALPQAIADALSAANLLPADLTLECPGFGADVDLNQQLRGYERLAGTGCPLSLEVRTRTVASLLDLSPFPFAEVKTGGSHILRYARASRGGPGLAAIAELVSFAKERSIRTVAVGIEDETSAVALATVGFDAGQGNALGRAEHLDRPTTSEKAPAPTDTVLPDAPQPALRSDEAMKARLAAAKRMATKRFHAANTARQLQWRLQASLSDRSNSDEPTQEAVPTPIGKSSVHAATGVTALVEQLPADIFMRASAMPNLSHDPTVQEEDGQAEAVVGDLETDHVRFAVADAPRAFALPEVLRRKYRITHFWPRSWKRAWTKFQAERHAVGSADTVPDQA